MNFNIDIDSLGKHFPDFKAKTEERQTILDRLPRFKQMKTYPPVLTSYKGVQGKLRRADAMKLYEGAYFSEGDVLELGTSHGMSASIMADAILDSGSSYRITSVDLSEVIVPKARLNLQLLNFTDQIEEVVLMDATTFVSNAAQEGTKYGFFFIDHSHEEGHVKSVCELLPKIALPGAMVVFHDFNDARNTQAENKLYGVAQGVLSGLNPDMFKFLGMFGCCGVFDFPG